MYEFYHKKELSGLNTIQHCLDICFNSNVTAQSAVYTLKTLVTDRI